ncbi:hypothetical protein HYS91_02640 [Candidatus Daviesbacteria bacterium]|nr:hypothetical protein [Candidatus Daviesbacteria bacterium]
MLSKEDFELLRSGNPNLSKDFRKLKFVLIILIVLTFIIIATPLGVYLVIENSNKDSSLASSQNSNLLYNTGRQIYNLGSAAAARLGLASSDTTFTGNIIAHEGEGGHILAGPPLSDTGRSNKEDIKIRIEAPVGTTKVILSDAFRLNYPFLNAQGMPSCTDSQTGQKLSSCQEITNFIYSDGSTDVDWNLKRGTNQIQALYIIDNQFDLGNASTSNILSVFYDPVCMAQRLIDSEGNPISLDYIDTDPDRYYSSLYATEIYSCSEETGFCDGRLLSPGYACQISNPTERDITGTIRTCVTKTPGGSHLQSIQCTANIRPCNPLEVGGSNESILDALVDSLVEDLTVGEYCYIEGTANTYSEDTGHIVLGATAVSSETVRALEQRASNGQLSPEELSRLERVRAIQSRQIAQRMGENISGGGRVKALLRIASVAVLVLPHIAGIVSNIPGGVTVGDNITPPVIEGIQLCENVTDPTQFCIDGETGELWFYPAFLNSFGLGIQNANIKRFSLPNMLNRFVRYDPTGRANLVDENGRVAMVVDAGLKLSRLHESANNLTGRVLKEIFPNKNFRVLLNEGSGGVLWQDIGEPSLVYKVAFPLDDVPKDTDWENWYSSYRHSDDTYQRNEAKVIALLNQYGLTPRLHLFVPSSANPDPIPGRVLDTVEIPISRQTSRVPIIVMDYVEINEDRLDQLPEEQKRQWALRTAQILESLRLFPADTEIVFDEISGTIKFVDLGGMSEKYDGLVEHFGSLYERLSSLLQITP